MLTRFQGRDVNTSRDRRRLLYFRKSRETASSGSESLVKKYNLLISIKLHRVHVKWKPNDNSIVVNERRLIRTGPSMSRIANTCTGGGGGRWGHRRGRSKSPCFSPSTHRFWCCSTRFPRTETPGGGAHRYVPDRRVSTTAGNG